MKIMILGTGKSGTTALVYKVAGGLPNCQAFSGGRPGKYIGDYENAVYKHTYQERKGKTFNLYEEHLQKENYDRMIWIARDPRDAAVSRMLYRWHRGYSGNKNQYKAHLELVQKKEQNPRSIPFHFICRYAGHNGWPITVEQVVEEEQVRYQNMVDFVKTLSEDWYLFTYENMVGKNFDGLNEYLGFEVEADGEVPKSTGKVKVVRKKAVGDWRHWFTEEDVEIYKPAYKSYMKLIGYDLEDWYLSPNPVIEPEYSSMYMKSLPRMKTGASIRSFKDLILRLFGKRE
ncbi:MAG: sulfotransferase domain-containing protein [Desulfuromonadales bacterium]|nr:sulfotransferase domain-containing protein [Desulfuromonadales bacterium]